MKVTVKINDRSFDVEITDLYARPIVATVEGERFEVWPENGGTPAAKTTAPAATNRPAQRFAAAPTSAASASGDAKIVRAPIPGVIISVAVAVGDQIEAGQEICVLEAMKMKNVIRAPRAGEIGKVLVKAGEHVQHHDMLIEYAE